MDVSEDAAAFEAFLLGLRVFYQLYAPDAPASEFERPWESLREVASGRMTLTNTADLAARYPGMAAFLYERANRIVASDRANAERILRGLQESLRGSALEE
jgi:hypothetical protein